MPEVGVEVDAPIAPTRSGWSGGPARRFLRAARKGEPADVVGFLAAEPGLGLEEVVAVLRADQRVRWRAGSGVWAEWYFARFSRVASDPELALDLIFSEFLLREAIGEVPEVAEYLDRFPRFADAIRLQASFHFALGAGMGPGQGSRGDGVPSDRPTGDLPAIPGYQLLREMGSGGMGVVYEAVQLRLKRRVALKMVRRGLDDDPDLESRFQKEAEAAARMNHPNIVEIFEIGEFEGRAYFTLELVEGGDLSIELASGPMSPRRAAQLTETLAHAMHYAHERGIIHRDLKPANILMTPEGVPKIADFGLAKLLGSDSIATQNGTILGSPCYMSPEQASGGPDRVGRGSDVYSLGAICYEMLTGAPPFRSDSPLDTLHKLLNEEPARPRSIVPKVPRDLETICLKCLERTPSRRYESAGELAEDLDRFLNHDLIRARPVWAPERLWRLARRKTSTAVVASLAGLAIAATVGLSISLAAYHYQSARRIGEALREVESRQRRVDQMAALLAYDHGQALAEQGDVSHGLLWLVRGLKQAEQAGDRPLDRAFRRNISGWSKQVHRLQSRWEHLGPILAVAFSPDGQLGATAGDDGQVRFWWVASGEPAGSPIAHPMGVNALAFGPDGKTLATACVDSFVRTWEVDSGRQVGPTFAHEKSVLGVAISPDGKMILTGGTDETARLWDLRTGEPIGRAMKHDGYIDGVAFSPDGQAALTSSWDKTARLWDARTGDPIGKLVGHTDWVSSAAFSPDGKSILTGSYDRTARLWDRATGKPVGSPMKHQHCVGTVAFGPDGSLVATGSYDGTARIWSVPDGRPVGPLLRHQHTVSGVAFSPDGKTLLTGGYDRAARVWRVARPSGVKFAHDGFIRAVTFSPDGRTVLSASQDQTARLWDSSTGRAIGPPLRHSGSVESIAFGPDGRTVLTGSLDGTARLWDAVLGEPIGPPLRHGAGIRSVAFSPDGKTVLTGSDDKTARLWKASDGRAIGGPLVHDAGVRTVAFSSDGRFAATGGDDRTARLWDAADALPVRAPLGHGGAVKAVAFSPDGRSLLTGSDDMMARLWSLDTGMLRVPALLHDGPVSVAAFSPDGRAIITGGWDRVARLWDSKTGQPLAQPLQHDGPLRALAFSPDGRDVITGSYDRTAQIWDEATGRPIGPAFRHESQVWFVAFNPRGKVVLSGGQENSAHLWEIPETDDRPLESLKARVQVATGMELLDDGSLHVLGILEWNERRMKSLKEAVATRRSAEGSDR